MKEYSSFEEKKAFFNPDTWRIIDSPSEFENLISDFREFKQGNSHTVFRGICNAKYKLYTSLQRECFSKNIDTNEITPKKIVIKLLSEARKPSNKNILPDYYRQLGIPLNDWLLLAILQHYGAPSPLLDFTKDFLPALYFMCLNMVSAYSQNEIDKYFSIVYFKGVDACAHVIENIRKTGLNIYKRDTPGLETYQERAKFSIEALSFENIMRDRELELIPSYKGVTNITHNNNKWIVNLPISNMNMVSQEGEFICNISPDKPIEELMRNNGINYLNCVNIHKKLYHYIIDKYLAGSLDFMRNKLFPSESQAASDIYFRTMSSLFS